MAHLWSNKKTAVCHSSERRLSPFTVLYLFVYLPLNELMRALQTTLIQFDHNCPQYSIIDVATTETSLCYVLVPALLRHFHIHLFTKLEHKREHNITTACRSMWYDNINVYEPVDRVWPQSCCFCFLFFVFAFNTLWYLC